MTEMLVQGYITSLNPSPHHQMEPTTPSLSHSWDSSKVELDNNISCAYMSVCVFRIYINIEPTKIYLLYHLLERIKLSFKLSVKSKFMLVYL